MKFLERLQIAVRVLRYGFFNHGSVNRPVVDVKSMPFSFPLWNLRREILPLTNYESYVGEGYAKNSVVYSCIRKIATTAPAAMLLVERNVNGQREQVDSELVSLFESPNPYVSSFTFQELIHTFLNLIGECFIIKVGFGGRAGRSLKKPELWFARPDRMFPVPVERKLLGYVYKAEDGRRMPFSPDEIIHIKYPNPLDPWEGLGRGLSPLSAAAIETDIDNSSTEFLKSFFDNACVPFGLLKSKQILQDDQIKIIRERMKDQYSAVDSQRLWHELMIIDADMDYEQMALSPNQFALPEIRGLTESRICSVFDVPAVLVGVQVGLKNQGAFNETQIRESRRQLWHDKIIPDNQRIAEIFTNAFKGQLGEGEVIGHDYSRVAVLQEDRTASFMRANQGYLGGWLTQNEARREAGLSSVVDGDNFRNENDSGTLNAKFNKRIPDFSMLHP
jgi:HK97 family phage portal protein